VGGLRAVAPEALHVTLCFLGWRWVSEIDAIGAACSAAGCFDPPALALGAARWLPARRPRVLAVAIEDHSAQLARIQAELSRALQEGGWYVPEARPFLAHVTICRVARGARVRAVELPPPRALAFDGSTVTLYRSRLGAGGARYEALRRVAL
jgi:RNA 2',3'-cyclic 3'-phosphodiesterase